MGESSSGSGVVRAERTKLSTATKSADDVVIINDEPVASGSGINTKKTTTGAGSSQINKVQSSSRKVSKYDFVNGSIEMSMNFEFGMKL